DTLSGRRFARDDVAYFGLTIAGAYMPFLPVVKPELVFVQGANRDFNQPFPVGQYNRFIGDNRAQVFLYRVAHSLAMTLLVDLSLSLQRPVISLNCHRPFRTFSDNLKLIGQ